MRLFEEVSAAPRGEEAESLRRQRLRWPAALVSRTGRVI